MTVRKIVEKVDELVSGVVVEHDLGPGVIVQVWDKLGKPAGRDIAVTPDTVEVEFFLQAKPPYYIVLIG